MREMGFFGSGSRETSGAVGEFRILTNSATNNASARCPNSESPAAHVALEPMVKDHRSTRARRLFMGSQIAFQFRNSEKSAIWSWLAELDGGSSAMMQESPPDAAAESPAPPIFEDSSRI